MYRGAVLYFVIVKTPPYTIAFCLVAFIIKVWEEYGVLYGSYTTIYHQHHHHHHLLICVLFNTNDFIYIYIVCKGKRQRRDTVTALKILCTYIQYIWYNYIYLYIVYMLYYVKFWFPFGFLCRIFFMVLLLLLLLL